MIKLIATDMDGTFLRSDHKEPTDFPEVMKALKSQNILFAAASGRPYLTLCTSFSPYLDDMVFIADNGAHIVYQGKTLATYPLENILIQQLIGKLRPLSGCYGVLCTTEGAFVESNEPAFIKELEKYYVKYTVVEDLSKVTVPVIKFTCCDLNGAEFNSYPHFQSFSDTLQVCLAGEVWVDVMVKGVNKGTALQKLQSILHISEKEMMAFGDYLNDVEMLQHVYYSYAMANAHPDLFKIARFKAPSNDENGVMVTIKERLNL